MSLKSVDLTIAKARFAVLSNSSFFCSVVSSVLTSVYFPGSIPPWISLSSPVEPQAATPKTKEVPNTRYPICLILLMLFNLIVVNGLIAGFYDVKLLKYINFK